ncbi:MAG: MFS transporter [Actinomycetota bacterium]|nr:MFS transporter [Actinomycetota bacterium]
MATTTDDNLLRRRRRHVIGSGAVLIALSGPGQTAGFSVFVDPLTEALDVSRNTLTFAYLVGTLAASTTGGWLGRRLDRVGVGRGLRLVSTALMAALLLASASMNIVMLTVAIYGLRSFGQTGMPLSASVFVAKAVRERRGAALGALTALGGSAIPATPLLGDRLIDAFGWRAAWWVLAGIVAVVGLTMSRRIARLESDGIGAGTEAGAEHDADGDEASGLTRDALWGWAVVTAGFVSAGFVATGLGFHQIAILGERGLSSSSAAGNFVPQSLASVVTALVVGRLVDRVPARVVVPFNMAVLALAAVSIGWVSSPLSAAAYGVAVGMAAAATAASEGALIARWIPAGILGTWRGRMTSVMVVSTALAPYAFSLLADATGSFTTTVRLAALVPLTVATVALVAPLPSR